MVLPAPRSLLADTARPYFELLYLPFSADAPRPRIAAPPVAFGRLF